MEHDRNSKEKEKAVIYKRTHKAQVEPIAMERRQEWLERTRKLTCDCITPDITLCGIMQDSASIFAGEPMPECSCDCHHRE